jgi:hypothetical protein
MESQSIGVVIGVGSEQRAKHTLTRPGVLHVLEEHRVRPELAGLITELVKTSPFIRGSTAPTHPTRPDPYGSTSPGNA